MEISEGSQPMPSKVSVSELNAVSCVHGGLQNLSCVTQQNPAWFQSASEFVAQTGLIFGCPLILWCFQLGVGQLGCKALQGSKPWG